MNTNKTKNSKILPFSTIEMAASGDVDAINAVLKHYEGYIIALSTVRLYTSTAKPVILWTMKYAGHSKQS